MKYTVASAGVYVGVKFNPFSLFCLHFKWDDRLVVNVGEHHTRRYLSSFLGTAKMLIFLSGYFFLADLYATVASEDAAITLPPTMATLFPGNFLKMLYGI